MVVTMLSIFIDIRCMFIAELAQASTFVMFCGCRHKVHLGALLVVLLQSHLGFADVGFLLVLRLL